MGVFSADEHIFLSSPLYLSSTVLCTAVRRWSVRNRAPPPGIARLDFLYCILQYFLPLCQQGITDLVAAFYKQVPGDDILGPMYPSDEMDAAEARLRDFLIFRLGGPQTYIEQRGHPRLRMRHMPFAIDVNARNRWIALMTNALDEIEISAKDRELMLAFFEHLATFMINRQ